MSDLPSSAELPSSASDSRELTVRGHKIVVRIRGAIETVAAHDLRCEWCEKTLRPCYHTDRSTERVRRRFRSEAKAAEFGGTRYDGPDADGWYEAEGRTSAVTRRTFQDKFGSYGDNKFCGLGCARHWAIAVIDAIDKDKASLISTVSRKPITYHRAR
jgi:hypothetical protein